MDLESLTLVLTSRCNLRCRYCYAGPRRSRALGWPALRRSLDRLLECSSDRLEVAFTGGEPLLALPALERVVARVAERQRAGQAVRFKVVTNGLLLDDRVLEYLDAHAFVVTVSFDGVPAAQALRGATTFASLDTLLGRVRERFPQLWEERLKISLTLSPPAVPHLADSIDYFLRLGVRTINIGPVMGPCAFEPDGIGELDRQFELVSKMVLDWYERTGDVPVSVFRRSRAPGDSPHTEWVCQAALGGKVAIDVDGRAYGCVMATSTYQQRTAAAMQPAVASLAMGSVVSPAFPNRRSAMAGAARRCGAFVNPERRHSSYRRCVDCELLGRCASCPLAPAGDPAWTDPSRVPDFICAFNQVVMAHRYRFPPQTTALDILKGRA